MRLLILSTTLTILTAVALSRLFTRDVGKDAFEDLTKWGGYFPPPLDQIPRADLPGAGRPRAVVECGARPSPSPFHAEGIDRG